MIHQLSDPRSRRRGSYGIYIKTSKGAEEYHLKYAMAYQLSAERKVWPTAQRATSLEERDVPLDWCEVCVIEFKEDSPGMPSPFTLAEHSDRIKGFGLVVQCDFEGSFLYTNTQEGRRLSSDALRRDSKPSPASESTPERKSPERPPEKPTPSPQGSSATYHSREWEAAQSS